MPFVGREQRYCFLYLLYHVFVLWLSHESVLDAHRVIAFGLPLLSYQAAVPRIAQMVTVWVLPFSSVMVTVML